MEKKFDKGNLTPTAALGKMVLDDLEEAKVQKPLHDREGEFGASFNNMVDNAIRDDRASKLEALDERLAKGKAVADAEKAELKDLQLQRK
ncbi:hypothetical protein [Mogibacterium diversum]|uniref:hypothetical protein n=1 Tax=Mogibacterium diversum TaxID=114527 RepID=UPI0028D15A71|nr:hypothetical protein [Mogibacterium diversum]